MDNARVKKFGYYFAAIVFLAAIVVGIKMSSHPTLAPEGETGQFSITIDYGDKADIYEGLFLGGNETAFSAIQNQTTIRDIGFAYEDYGDMGMLVTKIGDKESGDGFYWQYWVNGQYSQVGASAYKIRNGDAIEWRFTDAQQ
jgi:hypothetical protein